MCQAPLRLDTRTVKCRRCDSKAQGIWRCGDCVDETERKFMACTTCLRTEFGVAVCERAQSGPSQPEDQSGPGSSIDQRDTACSKAHAPLSQPLPVVTETSSPGSAGGGPRDSDAESPEAASQNAQRCRLSKCQVPVDFWVCLSCGAEIEEGRLIYACGGCGINRCTGCVKQQPHGECPIPQSAPPAKSPEQLPAPGGSKSRKARVPKGQRQGGTPQIARHICTVPEQPAPVDPSPTGHPHLAHPLTSPPHPPETQSRDDAHLALVPRTEEQAPLKAFTCILRVSVDMRTDKNRTPCDGCGTAYGRGTRTRICDACGKRYCPACTGKEPRCTRTALAHAKSKPEEEPLAVTDGSFSPTATFEQALENACQRPAAATVRWCPKQQAPRVADILLKLLDSCVTGLEQGEQDGRLQRIQLLWIAPALLLRRPPAVRSRG